MFNYAFRGYDHVAPKNMKFLEVGKLDAGLCLSQKSLFSIKNAASNKSIFNRDVTNLLMTLALM